MDNIKTWIGLSMEESIRMTKDRDKNVESTSMVWPTLGSRTAKEQEQEQKDFQVSRDLSSSPQT